MGQLLYRKVKKPHSHILEIKRSRFLAFAHAVNSSQQANDLLQQYRSDYPDARHHCFAFVAGSPDLPSTPVQVSDDGEPKGTAGRPIFSVIDAGNWGEILVVVVRYFGGIKLGAGGLTRAYRQVTAELLNQASFLEIKACETFELASPYENLDWITFQLEQLNAEILETQYTEQVVLRIRIEIDQVDSLEELVAPLAKNVKLSKL